MAHPCMHHTNHILFVALIFVLSGSMNTFSDGRLVSWKQSASCLAHVPNVQPVSSIPGLFFNFLFHFAAIVGSATLRVKSQLLLTEGDWHLCAQLLCLPAL